jgi:hypothetical protein
MDLKWRTEQLRGWARWRNWPQFYIKPDSWQLFFHQQSGDRKKFCMAGRAGNQ